MMQQHFEWHAGDIDDVLLWGARPLFHLVDVTVMFLQTLAQRLPQHGTTL
ncbi:hypothetical protein NGB58_24680 [Escherichia coli]|nr:hypothetical protein [Escherichia coli]